MKIVEGGVYLAANGQVVGPMMAFNRTRLIRAHGDGFTWTMDGKCASASYRSKEPWDLVSEVDPDKVLESML